MPDFYIDDLDISPSEFVDACSDREITQLIEILIEDGYISNESILKSDGTYSDTSYTKALVKLSESRLRLTNEEEEIIKKIAERL
jgi:dTDP-glucose pyrophosphorylase